MGAVAVLHALRLSLRHCTDAADGRGIGRCGARTRGVVLVPLRHITIPLLLPALLSSALVVFVTSAGLFDVPLAMAAPKGIRTMPTEIFSLVQYPSDLGRAASFGVVVMSVTVLLTLLQRRFLDRRRFETVTGKGYRPRPIVLRPLGRAAALGLEIVYIGSGVVLPVVALLMVSFSSIWTGQLRPRP